MVRFHADKESTDDPLQLVIYKLYSITQINCLLESPDAWLNYVRMKTRQSTRVQKEKRKNLVI